MTMKPILATVRYASLGAAFAAMCGCTQPSNDAAAHQQPGATEMHTKTAPETSRLVATADPSFQSKAEAAGEYDLVLYFVREDYQGLLCGNSQGGFGYLDRSPDLGYCKETDYIVATVKRSPAGQWAVASMRCVPDLRTPEAAVAFQAAEADRSLRSMSSTSR